MLIAWLAVPIGRKLMAAEKQMQKEIRKGITKEDLNSMNDTGAFSMDGLYDMTNEELQKEFTDIVEEVVKVIKEDRRDITRCEHKGDYLYITGGMSWGDAPTDAFTLFDKFLNMPDRITQHLLNDPSDR